MAGIITTLTAMTAIENALLPTWSIEEIRDIQNPTLSKLSNGWNLIASWCALLPTWSIEEIRDIQNPTSNKLSNGWNLIQLPVGVQKWLPLMFKLS